MIKLKLTDEQRQIVEDNHNLIYGYARDNNLDIDDWYGLLSIELCESVMEHNPEKSKLSTFFYLRADYLVLEEYRKTQTKKRFNNGLYPLKEELVGGQCENIYMEEKLLLEDLLDHQYKDIIKLKYDGYNQSEIADIVGISQSQVSRILNQVRDDYFGEEEIEY